MELKDNLTDLEVAKLIVLNKDNVLVEALRKVFLYQIYGQGVVKKGHKSEPLRNAALNLVARSSVKEVTNETLGQDLRALWEGLNAIEQAFNYLATLKDDNQGEKVEENNAI